MSNGPAIAPELVSQAECARRLGISRNSVYVAVKSGRLPTVGPRRQIDMAVAEAAWAANTDPTSPRGRKGARGPAYGTYSEARGRREHVLAKLAELDYGRKTGALVSADEVERQAFDSARRARNAILSVPARLAAVLAGITDPAEIERRLREELVLVCEGLAH